MHRRTIRMKNRRIEAHRRRLERVCGWERQARTEYAAFEGRIVGARQQRLPLEVVVFRDRADRWKERVWICRQLLVLDGQAPDRCRCIACARRHGKSSSTNTPGAAALVAACRIT